MSLRPALLAAAALILPTVSAQAQQLVIRNVTVVSPERSAPLARATVVIEGGLIRSVSTTAAPTAATGLDGTGKFLMPGLTDSHLHTNVLPGIGLLDGRRARAFPAQVEQYREQLRASLLYHGVTQLIDPASGKAPWRTTRRSPDAFYCGAIPVLGGYPMNLLGKGEGIGDADMPYLVDDPARADRWPAALDRTLHTPEAVVQRIHADGAVCVKLFFENGFGPRADWPMLSGEVMSRIVAEARRLGLTVLAHANATDMQELALAANVDVMGHGLWNWTGESGQPDLPPRLAAHLDRLVEHGTGFQPTLRVMEGIRSLFDPAALDGPDVAAVVPPALLAWYRTPAAQSFKRELHSDDFDDMPEARAHAILQRPVSQGARVVRYLAERGHPLLLGSDHPATPGHTNQPGLSSRQELGHMSAAGVSPMALLAAGTINNARAFGLEERYGTVEVGKVANLLLLGENPLEGVEAYDSIETVVLRGEAFRREGFLAR